MQSIRRRGTVPWLVAAALLAVVAAPVWAQSQPTEANMAQLDIGDGNVSFDVRGRTLAEVVERIRDKTKLTHWFPHSKTGYSLFCNGSPERASNDVFCPICRKVLALWNAK